MQKRQQPTHTWQLFIRLYPIHKLWNLIENSIASGRNRWERRQVMCKTVMQKWVYNKWRWRRSKFPCKDDSCHLLSYDIFRALPFLIVHSHLDHPRSISWTVMQLTWCTIGSYFISSGQKKRREGASSEHYLGKQSPMVKSRTCVWMSDVYAWIKRELTGHFWRKGRLTGVVYSHASWCSFRYNSPRILPSHNIGDSTTDGERRSNARYSTYRPFCSQGQACPLCVTNKETRSVIFMSCFFSADVTLNERIDWMSLQHLDNHVFNSFSKHLSSGRRRQTKATAGSSLCPSFFCPYLVVPSQTPSHSHTHDLFISFPVFSLPALSSGLFSQRTFMSS